MRKLAAFVCIFSTCFCFCLSAQEIRQETKEEKTTFIKPEPKEEFSETKQTVKINGHSINYKATAGNLILKDEEGKPKATCFFVSYAKEDEKSDERPLTFCFNGGPGSSSIWLHMGVFGPMRVNLTDDGDAVPPYRFIDNEYSILDVTDLVFIDPISTGFSRAVGNEDIKQFHGVDEDVKWVGEFIRLYISRYDRWDSPKFLAGESYGTTRAAALASYLHDEHSIYFNGLVLISSVLNFQTIDFIEGNDLPYPLALPSFTATAWYHKKLPADLQIDFYRALQESESFAMNEYVHALMQGDLLPQNEKEQVIQKLARFTGLSPEFISRSNLRIDVLRFVKELMRNDSRTVGRFDSRVKGIDSDSAGEHFEYDPSVDAIAGAFASTFNQYLGVNLKWRKDDEYKIFADVWPWNYGKKGTNQYLNVAETLREVMTKNPYLKVFVANGYYDLATPYFATEYTFNHLGLDPILRSHIIMGYYPSGHMMYTHKPSLIKLKEDLQRFVHTVLSNGS